MKEYFIDFLNMVSQKEHGFVGVVVKLPGQDKPEVIVNHTQSMSNKTQYLSVTYDMDLSLIANPEVRILGYRYCETFEDVISLMEVAFRDE